MTNGLRRFSSVIPDAGTNLSPPAIEDEERLAMLLGMTAFFASGSDGRALVRSLSARGKLGMAETSLPGCL
jgi:hypothetical protein